MNDFLKNICHVGEYGEQTLSTCPYLNRSKDRGYFCMKLTENAVVIAEVNKALTGKPCVGLPDAMNLELI